MRKYCGRRDQGRKCEGRNGKELNIERDVDMKKVTMQLGMIGLRVYGRKGVRDGARQVRSLGHLKRKQSRCNGMEGVSDE